MLRRIQDRPDVLQALNWPDRELSRPVYWTEDRLHMNRKGYALWRRMVFPFVQPGARL